MAYITSAFISQADPGVMSQRVALGPELEKALGLQAGAAAAKVYDAVVPLPGEQRIEVRRAAAADIEAYGRRRNFDSMSANPVFTVSGDKTKLLVQYDLQALAIVFVGQPGLPDPDPRPTLAAAQPRAQTPASGLVNVAWTAEFQYNSAKLTPELRTRLDEEVVPKLMASKDITYLHVYGHTDRLGSRGYNQRLSEKRAEAVRAYLIAKGVDADKIEVLGYGQTLPVKSCPQAAKRSELIECLAPNRRIVVEVQAKP